MAHLLFINPTTSKEVIIQIKPSGILIGRHPYCEVRISDGKVSREHARIDLTDDGAYLEDLRSRNGTCLNDIQIHSRARLFDQDRISICGKDFTFCSTDERDIRSDDNTASRQIESSVLFHDSSNDQVSITSSIQVSTSTVLEPIPTSYEDQAHEITMLRAKLVAITELSKSLGKVSNVRNLHGEFLRKSLSIFSNAETVCLIIQGVNGDFQLLDYVQRGEHATQTFRISRTILDEVVRMRAGILSDDLGSDTNVAPSETMLYHATHSVMAVPVYNPRTDKLVGIFQYHSIENGKPFSHEDLDLLVSIANQVSVYYENILIHSEQIQEKVTSKEMSVAFEVQKGFLPMEVPRIANYRFYDYYHPASYLGGDYFDYIPLPNGQLAVAIGDVSGKGISAALLMAKLSSEVRHRILLESDLPKVVEQLNDVFCGSHWDDRFITFSIAILDPKAHSLRVVNAGHPYPIISSLNGQTEELINQGSFPLGIVPGATYEEHIFKFEPGNIISFMSDGLSDAMDDSGTYFSQESVREYLQNKEGFNAEELGGSLMYAIREFTAHAKQSDDQCLVMIGRDK